MKSSLAAITAGLSLVMGAIPANAAVFFNGLSNPSQTPPPGYPNPYTTSSTIFMGDNTSSASAKVTISKVEVY